MDGKPSQPNPSSGPGGPQALFAQACTLQMRGDLAQAEQTYRELLRQHPAHGDSYCNLGVLLAGSARLEEAEQVLRQAVSCSPGNVDARANLGVILRRQGKFADAVTTLHEALARNRRHENANYNLGLTLSDLGREAEAVQFLQQAVASNSDNVLAQDSLTRALHAVGRDGEAVQHGMRVLLLKDAIACANFKRGPPAALLRDPSSASFRVPEFQPRARARNVIAFTLWGAATRHTLGAIANARIAPYLYPEWTCRFYHDESVPAHVLEELRRLGAEVVPCVSRGPGHGLFWRLYVANDPNIDRFLCRDCDSRLNVQEKVAVDEWLVSGQPFHIMRDAVVHCELILAGLWGGVAGILPDMRTLTDEHVRPGQHKWTDQDLLREVIWPLIKEHSLSHDAHYDFQRAKRFPPCGRRPPWLHVGAGETPSPAEQAWRSAATRLGGADAGTATLYQSEHTALQICRHGVMAFNTHDTFIGRSLQLYGEWCESEMALLGQLLRPGDVVLDIGANIGTHAVYFAKVVTGSGSVVAVEPQSYAFQLLCANVVLNDLHNVHCVRQAVAASDYETWIPQLDPARAHNVGALRVDQQIAGHGERIVVTTLDRLAAALDLTACRLIKIDVEGMEGKVLEGAQELISKYRPMLFVENNQQAHSPALIARLFELDYRCWWHVAPYFNPRNFRGTDQNVFGNVHEANMLCVHSSVPVNIELPAVLGADDDWRAAVARMQHAAKSPT